jgi:hypothetical protein
VEDRAQLTPYASEDRFAPPFGHELGIPAKLNNIPEGSRTPFRAEGEHHRSEATLAF